MNLNRHGREHLKVQITTDPPVTSWEATFDGGTTWLPGVRQGTSDEYWWLLAGSKAAVGTAVAVLTPGTHPYTVRATAGNEIIARFSGSVHVE